MWLLILPMILLTVLIPFLLLAQDMRFEQNQKKAAHLAQMLQAYHDASLWKLEKNPSADGIYWSRDVNSFLPPNIKNGSFWQQTFADASHFPIDSFYSKVGNTCEVVSFIRTTEGVISLQDASGLLSRYWAQKGKTKVGVYRFKNKDFIDSSGKRYDLKKFDAQLPEHRNGVPVIYTIRSC